MSKGGSGDGLGLIFTFILVLTIIALWFIKWLLIVVALVICVIVGIVKLCNKKKSVNVYETKNYQIENEDDELITEDDNLFDKRIRQRGMEYYSISDSFPLKIMNDEIENNKEANRDKEYKNYGLSEGEIEVAKEGIYEKWDFEEEEMDEDSYYYEDDTGEIDDSDENDDEE